MTIRDLIAQLSALPNHERPVKMTDSDTRSGGDNALEVVGLLDYGDFVEVTYSQFAIDNLEEVISSRR